MKIFKVLALYAATFALGANAAIIDNEGTLVGSFKDTNTGIVWMDFGINNQYTYNEVVSKLAEGEEYEGWRLPDYDEVYEMWFSIIDASNPDLDGVREDFYGPGSHLYYDANSDGSDDSIWDNAFDAMGYNAAGNGLVFFDYTFVYGLFASSDALYSVVFDDFSDLKIDGDTKNDGIAFNNGWDQAYLASESNNNISTLLVRVNDIPGPNAFALFVLAVTAFTAVRRRQLRVIH
jgi:hypothetical protein